MNCLARRTIFVHTLKTLSDVRKKVNEIDEKN
jgi:hypothetical protein